jgi:hypothetical protein
LKTLAPNSHSLVGIIGVIRVTDKRARQGPAVGIGESRELGDAGLMTVGKLMAVTAAGKVDRLLFGGEDERDDLPQVEPCSCEPAPFSR